MTPGQIMDGSNLPRLGRFDAKTSPERAGPSNRGARESGSSAAYGHAGMARASRH